MAKPREGLQRRRRQLGYTQESIAEQLGVAVNTYSEWERGVKTPRVGFRPRLADRLDVSLVEIDHWLDGDPDQAVPVAGVEVPSWLGHFASLEQAASALWSFEPMVVHGLLQTAAYAEAVERRGPDEISPTAVDQKVRLRLARQHVLARGRGPLRLSVVLDESVLYRVAGDRAVMLGQLERLIDEAQRPNVDLRILTFAAGEFCASFGAFTLFASPGAAQPYMACVHDRAGAHYLDRPHEVFRHADLFRYLQRAALSPAASVELIRRSKERYR